MKVTLVGAGPSDKGLLTLKGAQRIRSADVVLYDRYVGEEIIAMIPDAAEKISVGKTAGIHPVPQDEINHMLLEKARQGLSVVRLKGGDPFVFGRGGEELEFLAENGIPFEVVPGVTSAIAGAAYAGIPVTHRDVASSLHIITAHAKNNSAPSINYDSLVRMKGTLIFLMGLAAVKEICESLISSGMDKGMPSAIVENATTGVQRKFVGTVETLPAIARENAVESPAIIIIGNVCTLSERCDWLSGKPLFGRRVIVSRTKPETSKLSDSLRELGCYVAELLPAKIMPCTFPGSPLEGAIERIETHSWLVFTSSVGVNVFFDYFIDAGFDIRMLHHLKIACVGAETEKELGRRGVKAAYRPDEYNGAALARGLSGLVKSGERLLIARAKDGAQDLTRILTDSGIAFDDVAIYEKAPSEQTEIDICADFVAFTSSSSVEWFVQSAANADFSKIKAVCIGERTAAAAVSYGMVAYVSDQATMESIVNKIRELCM